MDYKRIYNELIVSAKSKCRTKDKIEEYYESHHVIPDFMFSIRRGKGPSGHLPGNSGYAENKVLLTAREHFFAHLLLCRIYRKTRYEYSCLSSLMLMLGISKKNTRMAVNRRAFKDSIGQSSIYEKFRKAAVTKISEQRKGKIVCKDAITNEMVGPIDSTHEKIVSGEWVHHTKNTKLTDSHKKKISNSNTGLKNGNSRGYTDQQLVDSYIKCCNNMGWNVGRLIWLKYSAKYNEPCILHIKEFRFNGKGFKGLRAIASETIEYEYIDKFHLRKDTKEFYNKAIQKWL